MAEIFISHAGADSALVDKLVSFLKEGIGVPANSIFCSSIDGHDIPFTENFNEYMKNELQNPQLVLAVMTPKYMESWFCLMELGAAWSQFHKTLPIVVPPIDFDVVSNTLGLTQGWRISDEAKVIKLRETIRSLSITLEKRNEQDWEKKKTLFASDVKRILKKLPKPSSVSAEKYAALEERLKKAEAEREIFEAQYQVAQSMIEDLEDAKDKAAVKEIKKKHLGKDVDSEFKELIQAVSELKPSYMSKAFFIDVIIMDYHDRSIDIDFYDPDQKRMAQQAISSKLLSEDPGHPVMWRGKLKELGRAIEAVENFLAGEDAAELKDGYPLDASDRDFWAHHL